MPGTLVRGLVLVGGLTVASAAPAGDPVNLLANAGFEQEAAWTCSGAASLRNRWNNHDGGRYNAALLGTWATQGTEGVIEQGGIPVTAGVAYRASAWVYKDLGWHPMAQWLRVAFYDREGRVLKEHRTEFEVPNKREWQEVVGLALAPSNAVTASVGLGAHGISPFGALTIDDLSFSEVRSIGKKE